ncbi:sulfatase [Aquiflexum sp.]|uniref:sulfatase n=1 Tax=Aquiflexum sp. TaxID=1872584 RepID=UPI00359352B5
MIKKILSVFIFLLFASGINVNAQQKPNIIFILADDLGWKDVGFMGNQIIETPNLDKLASSGMVFTQGYSAGPMCTPTRASIMTGKYPADNQMFSVITSLQPPPNWDYGVPRGDNYDFFEIGNNIRTRSYLPLEEITVAEILKGEGYKTCYIGKWHLGHDPYHPLYQGFDVQIGTTNYGSPPTYFFPYETMRTEQKRLIEDLNKDGKPGEYLTDRLTDEAIGFIKKNNEHPFFISLNYYNPHSPYYAKEDLQKYYVEVKNLNDGDAEYAAMIHTLDQNVGKIVNAVKKLGLRKKTLIVFTSDNGGVGGKSDLAPLRGAKGSIYEGGIRVPVVFSMPGKIPPGKNEKDLVSSIDYFPTIHAFAGIHDTDPMIRGVNLLPVLEGKIDLEDRSLFWIFPQMENDMVIRKGDFKLIVNSKTGQKELYNLIKDPSESINLSEQHPEIVTRLDSLLKAF